MIAPKTPVRMQSRPIYLFLLCLYVNRFLVLTSVSTNSFTTQSEAYAENSPSLCPTISSVIATSLYIFPLCTWNTRPTKLGRMVADRAWVLIGGTFCPGAARWIGSLLEVRGGRMRHRLTLTARCWVLSRLNAPVAPE